MKYKPLNSNFKGWCFLSWKLPNKENSRRFRNHHAIEERNVKRKMNSNHLKSEERKKEKPSKLTKGEFYSWRIHKRETEKIRIKRSWNLIMNNSLRKNHKLQVNAISHKRELFTIYDFKPRMTYILNSNVGTWSNYK